MATRSSISLQRDNGEIISVYCHWDGYPEYNGKILKEHYTTMEKIEKLIALGNMSSLAENIYPAVGQEHSYSNPQENVCVFYHRDRNEDWKHTQPAIHNSVEEMIRFYKNSWCEYHYLFIDGEWKCYDDIEHEVSNKDKEEIDIPF